MKVGLVLAGGGGMGAYEIGAMKALRQLDIIKYIVAVSGTSIGALNASLLLQDDLEKAEDVWNNISVEKILPLSGGEFLFKASVLSLGIRNIPFIRKYVPQLIKEGKLTREGLIEILDRNIDFKKIRNSIISCYVCCTKMPEISPTYFNLKEYDDNSIKKILLATSAIPTIFQCEEIESKEYLDGGLVDNLPVQPVYGEGCNVIIVIHLSKLERIDRKVFPNAKLIEIFPTEIEDNVIDGILNFAKDAVQKRIHQGYKDTLDLLEPILELAKGNNENK